MVAQQSVGTSVPRVDGDAKVRGTAIYVDDIPVPDALHGATVRSRVPRGILPAIRRGPSFGWSGVSVVTAENVPGQSSICLIGVDQPALVRIGGRVRHVDEPGALVAAPTRARAIAAAAAI